MDTISSEPHLLFDLAWIFEPTAWMGLLTLTAIQVVLGLDNLIFIAILSAKLPPKNSRKARYIGLGGALIIRIILVIFAAYIIAASKPLFTVMGFAISWRDILMLLGGAFLIYKSTEELHGKLEGSIQDETISVTKAASHSLFTVAAQICILDVMFSADSIITAVAMTNHVYIMLAAVTASMVVLTWASGIITEFVGKHPTLVILCLGFLLLIGFSLIMEGLHIYVPKGYLYSAIGFSLLIEIFNQVSRKNLLKIKRGSNLQSRELAAHLVMRLLGSKKGDLENFKEMIYSKPNQNVFNNQEKEMVSRVLQLSTLPVKAVMTARCDLEMLRIDDSSERILAKLGNSDRSKLIAYRKGQKDLPLGYVSKAAILSLFVKNAFSTEALEKNIVTPLYLPETVNILKALEQFRQSKKYLGFVFDEFGCFEGIVTLHDIMEEVAGEMPERTEVPEIISEGANEFKVDGDAILKDVQRITGLYLPPSEHYQTIAGFVLEMLQRLPKVGEAITYDGYRLEVVDADATSVKTIRLVKINGAKSDPSQEKTA